MTPEEFHKRYQYNPTTDCLGEGGFGKVYKAYDIHRDRWVAIKMAEVKPHLEEVRLKKEVEMISKLTTHPNIAYYEECHTFSTFAGEYDFGILQYYDHGNLQQLLSKVQLTESQKDSILRQILEGIDFLHNQGIIHRDIKPQNILIVNRNGEYIPKITDFGISKKLDVNKSSVFTNSLAGAGTLSYASPEQLCGQTIKKNTDLWSFGVIAYWVLLGKLPFNTGAHANTSEAGRAEFFKQISSGSIPGEINTLAPRWQTLIKQCLKVDPETRIKKVAECSDFLNVENTGQPNQKEEKTEIGKPVNTSLPTRKPEIEEEVNPVNFSKYLPWVIGLVMCIFLLLVFYYISAPKTSIPLPEMVLIQGGSFNMGSPTDEQGRDDFELQHRVTISSFYMGKTEVTFAQYDAFCEAMGCKKPDDAGWGRGDRPVINVSWDDAAAYCKWLSRQTNKKYRLPTEAEWEYSCRAGTTTPFNTGRNFTTEQANYIGNFPNNGRAKGQYRKQTMPVGSFAPNGWGLCDMHGNVWEWCSDWYGDYPLSEQIDPSGPTSGYLRVGRGGGWNHDAFRCRSALRNGITPDYRYYDIGFRLAHN